MAKVTNLGLAELGSRMLKRGYTINLSPKPLVKPAEKPSKKVAK